MKEWKNMNDEEREVIITLIGDLSDIFDILIKDVVKIIDPLVELLVKHEILS